MDWTQMVGQTQNPAQTPPVDNSFSLAQQPLPQDVAAAMTPPSSPEEFEARKAGWATVMEKLKDPNVQRALSYAGTYLMQPIPFGQNALGHLGGAINIGLTAYDMGKQALLNEEKLRTAMEHGRAQTEDVKAKTESTKLSNEKTRQTMQDAIAEIKTHAKKAELELKTATRKDEVDAILSKYETRKAQILNSFSDDDIALQVSDTLQKQGIENDLKKAQTETERMKAAAHTTQANAYAEYMRNRPADPQQAKIDAVEQRKQEIAPYFQKLVENGIAAIKAKNPKLSDAEAANTFWTLQDPKNLFAIAEMQLLAARSAPTQGQPKAGEPSESKEMTLSQLKAKVEALKAQEANAAENAKPKKSPEVAAVEAMNQKARDKTLEEKFKNMSDAEVRAQISAFNPYAQAELERRARVAKEGK